MIRTKPRSQLRSTTGPTAGPGGARLVANPGTAEEHRIYFRSALEIGRDERSRSLLPGLLLLRDAKVSRRHCILTCSADGRCYVRDLSRNGTRIAGRRLVPNIETEIRPGETLTVGRHHFVLDARAPVGQPLDREWLYETAPAPADAVATVLVGDIRNYTGLVRRARRAALQESVSRLFEILTSGVVRQGGTVKEYPGDAVLAFWEGGSDGTHAIAACGAALELDRLAGVAAADRAIWQVPGFPLLMDWALATGAVMIQTFGGHHPQGLSLVGEPAVLAFRLEQLAGDERGRILVCGRTRDMAATHFAFRDLGEIAIKGFDAACHVYALQGRLEQATVRAPV